MSDPSPTDDRIAYDGHVDAGGPPALRTLPAVTITKLSVGPMDNNAYLLVCRTTGDALLIGLIIYALYGYRHSKLRRNART